MIGEKYINILYIDLDNEEYRYEKRGDLAKFIGGTGVAAKLLDENIRPDLDVLDPAQPIVFAIGPLSFIMPLCTKVVAAFYSPHTGEYGESHAGGRLAMAMRFNDIDAMVIRGRARSPRYLVVNDEVKFRDARALWGMTVDECGKFLRQHTSGSGIRSSLRIGRAGENLITYAGVNVDTYRHFGRLGLGAVFGSKNLKGMVVIGDNSTPIPKDMVKEYRKTYDRIYNTVLKTDVMEKYHGIGTSINVVPLNEINSLPTLNLSASSYEFAEEISGERFAEESLVRKVACSGCPVGCIHIGQFRREFDKGYEYETVKVSYDHELVFALGSFLGIKSANEVLQLIDAVEREGLDAISTGVALGWATEALGKGVISTEETIYELEFGNTEGFMEAVSHISTAANEFYKALGKGVDFASRAYGGEDFACQLGGNEMAGYHTGYGSVVGFAIGSRHSHLDNGGYSYDQGKVSNEELAEKLLQEEIERNILTSLVICLFARKVYSMEVIENALGSIGIRKSREELLELGREILRLKYDIKKKLGYNLGDIKIPQRFFETQSYRGKLERAAAEKIIEEYAVKLQKI